MLLEPNFVSLDSAQLVSWLDDRMANEELRRTRARNFQSRVSELEISPIINLHHVLEIFGHDDINIVVDRIFSIQQADGLYFFEGRQDRRVPFAHIMDLLLAEACSAQSSEESSRQIRGKMIRKLNSDEVFYIGHTDDALALQRICIAERHNNVSTSAIKRIDFEDFGLNKKTIEEISLSPKSENIDQNLQAMRILGAEQIRARADKRIDDPKLISNLHLKQVEKEIIDFEREKLIDEIRDIFVKLNIKFNIKMKFSQFLTHVDMLAFSKLINKNSEISIESAFNLLYNNRIPSFKISRCIEKYEDKKQRSKGSNLVDRYLVCFSPYVSTTYVDRQTFDQVRRAAQRDGTFRSMIGEIKKTVPYWEI